MTTLASLHRARPERAAAAELQQGREGDCSRNRVTVGLNVEGLLHAARVPARKSSTAPSRIRRRHPPVVRSSPSLSVPVYRPSNSARSVSSASSTDSSSNSGRSRCSSAASNLARSGASSMTPAITSRWRSRRGGDAAARRRGVRPRHHESRSPRRWRRLASAACRVALSDDHQTRPEPPRRQPVRSPPALFEPEDNHATPTQPFVTFGHDATV
jgi:hypothetical protein